MKPFKVEKQNNTLLMTTQGSNISESDYMKALESFQTLYAEQTTKFCVIVNILSIVNSTVSASMVQATIDMLENTWKTVCNNLVCFAFVTTSPMIQNAMAHPRGVVKLCVKPDPFCGVSDLQGRSGFLQDPLFVKGG